MSRRVSRIQIPVVTTNRIRPTIESHQPSVVPITMQVIAIADQQRQQARPGKMDLLADGRRLVVVVVGHQCT